MGQFSYAAEKFGNARRSLMLPFPNGEASAIADAFSNCELGLPEVKDRDLDDNARHWARKLNELMDIAGLEDPSGIGLWSVKAQKLSVDQKFELSTVVDELACWFDEKALGIN